MWEFAHLVGVPPRCGTWQLDDFGQDVAFAENLVLHVIDFDFIAAVFAEEDFIADRDGKSSTSAIVEEFPRANGGHFAALRFFLGGVGQDDAARGFLFGIQGFDDDAIIERSEFHELWSFVDD